MDCICISLVWLMWLGAFEVGFLNLAATVNIRVLMALHTPSYHPHQPQTSTARRTYIHTAS